VETPLIVGSEEEEVIGGAKKMELKDMRS